MKLLIVGSDEVWSIERFYYRYIGEAGTQVEILPTFSYYLKFLSESIINRILNRLGISGIYKRVNKILLQKVVDYKPDVVWIFKGMEILPQTINWIKDQGVTVVNYNPDNPFIFTDRGSGNTNVTRSILLYDLHFTYNRAIKKQLEDLNQRVAILPFGFDISDEVYEDCANQEEIIKVCFIGTPDTKRVAFLKQLADEGISYDVYGNDWGRFLIHPNVTIHKAVYALEFWKILRRYRVQLNLMRIHNEDSHNMRSFEVPGIGGIMLAPDTHEHRLYFEEGKEVFLYKSVSDCATAIRRLLSLSSSEASQIRVAARERSLTSGYSYKNRAAQALKDLNISSF